MSDPPAGGDRVRVYLDADLHQMVLEVAAARGSRRPADVLNALVRWVFRSEPFGLGHHGLIA
jgi:hypothetical protein